MPAVGDGGDTVCPARRAASRYANRRSGSHGTRPESTCTAQSSRTLERPNTRRSIRRSAPHSRHIIAASPDARAARAPHVRPLTPQPAPGRPGPHPRAVVPTRTTTVQHLHGAYAPPFLVRPRSGARRPLPRHDPDGARSARQGDPYGLQVGEIVPVRHVVQLTPRNPSHRLHVVRTHPQFSSDATDHGSAPGVGTDPL